MESVYILASYFNFEITLVRQAAQSNEIIESRNGLLEKLPYTKGTTLLKFTGKQEKEDAEFLQIEKLKGKYRKIPYT